MYFEGSYFKCFSKMINHINDPSVTRIGESSHCSFFETVRAVVAILTAGLHLFWEELEKNGNELVVYKLLLGR